MLSKSRTNEQALRALLRDLAPLEAAMLRERMINMIENNRKAIAEKPGDFDNPIFHHTQYLALCDKVENYLRYED